MQAGSRPVVKPRFSSAVATANSASRVSSGLSLGPYTTGMKPRCGGSPRSLAINSSPLAGGRLYHAILERTGDALLSPDVCYWHLAEIRTAAPSNLPLLGDSSHRLGDHHAINGKHGCQGTSLTRRLPREPLSRMNPRLWPVP